MMEDDSFWNDAITRDWRVMRHAPDSIRTDRELCLQAIQTSSGKVLADVDESLRANGPFVLEAMRQTDGKAFAYAADCLRADHKLLQRSLILKQAAQSALAERVAKEARSTAQQRPAKTRRPDQDDLRKQLEKEHAEQKESRARQLEEQKISLQEHKQQLEDANRMRLHGQRQNLTEMKNAHKEFVASRQQEKWESEQNLSASKLEKEAMAKISKAMQRLRISSIGNYKEDKAELEQTISKELEKCHSQKERIRGECDQALEEAKTRVAELGAQQARAEQEKQAATARRKEADELITQLTTLLEDPKALSHMFSKEALESQRRGQQAPDDDQEAVSQKMSAA